jgi:peptide-methionine (R)-S-oxide reductase
LSTDGFCYFSRYHAQAFNRDALASIEVSRCSPIVRPLADLQISVPAIDAAECNQERLIAELAVGPSIVGHIPVLESSPMDNGLDRRMLLGLSGTAAMAGLTAYFSGRASPADAAGFEIQRSPADWRRRLGPARFPILRESGTERPFTSPLLDEHRNGVFACAGCALPLFSSAAKYDSGTGWPSFTRALPNAVATRSDVTLGMARTEEHCRRCGGHLGHVFDDGPKPLGKRHCINGLSLTFRLVPSGVEGPA